MNHPDYKTSTETEPNPAMNASDVLDLYNALDHQGIQIWVDGGWSVDALLERETRLHKDLDIAIQWKDIPKLRKLLAQQGYKEIKEDNKWNFVLGDDNGHEIDVHAFIYDDKRNVVEGIMYPADSLKGTGVIEGVSVRCISPKFMVEFLAPWIEKHPEKYLDAVAALCDKFGIPLPKEYEAYQQRKK